MRILDKNTDFYDYLQNVYLDSTLTFDRTDSFLLTKELMCNHLYVRRTYSPRRDKDRKHHNFVLLQICNTFWLFFVEITAINEYDRPVDYEIELVTSWREYNKPRVLCDLAVIEFSYAIGGQISLANGWWSVGYDRDKVYEKADILVQAVNTNDYKVKSRIDKHIVCYGNYDTKVEKHIPLLKACGIASLVDPLDVYLSFEEYFSLEKTASERREPIGTTDKDKIESHGFETKISFRGKSK
jgi:hypothetical protein